MVDVLTTDLTLNMLLSLRQWEMDSMFKERFLKLCPVGQVPSQDIEKVITPVVWHQPHASECKSQVNETISLKVMQSFQTVDIVY